MKSKAKKFIGPSKKMAEALEAEGLHVTWPTVIKDENDLAIEGTFETGDCWEKLVNIDLRRNLTLGTKTDVDKAIANELTAAYEAFDVDEEFKLNLGANGAPDAERLLEDMKEQEGCLKRFSDVADAVAGGRPIPPKEDEKDRETVHIKPETASRICYLLNTLTRAVGNRETGVEDEVKEVIAELKSKKGN